MGVIATTDTDNYDGIADALRYSQNIQLYESDLVKAKAEIEALKSGTALTLIDWEGTILKEYSKSEALALESLPNPSTFDTYEDVDHELLLFQKWNWSLADIKTWINNHEDSNLLVGAIYTTSDNLYHRYWIDPRSSQDNNKSRIEKTNAFYSHAYNYILKNINIPDGVTSIGTETFAECRSLTSINIPDSVTSIGQKVFNYCYSLKSITIPNSITSIGKHAFRGCYSLTSINIPDGVTSIGDSAFQDCHSLTSITIPDSVISIEGGAFSECHDLTSVNIPDGVTSIDQHTFYNCYSLTSINIPDSVTSIGQYAFYNCYDLTSITIPNNVTSIGNCAFSGCHVLTSVNIPDSVTSIGGSAFSGCKDLAIVRIGSGVTNIGNTAFNSATSLVDIILESKPALDNSNAFSGIDSNARFYVPRSDLSWFETGTNWSSLYTQYEFVAIEDYITYLESLGYDMSKYKE